MRGRSLLALALIPLAAACSGKYPASPVPAALTDVEAARLADVYQTQHKSPPLVLVTAEPQPDGYLMSYQSLFDPVGSPPKQARMFIVRNDGAVREITFKKDQ